MRYLIVNGDDFGTTRGINRGIMEAHRQGILTSASLMVDMPASEEAARLSRAAPDLSVGLHVHFDGPAGERQADLDGARCRAELDRQFSRFLELLGRRPSHLDSHHNVHRDRLLLPHFVALARDHGLPLRDHSPVRHVPQFYGQWGGETHLEQIGIEGLVRMLAAEVREGLTELGCHPGYVDPGLRSGYAVEREVELLTLCHPDVRRALAEQRIRLVSFHDVGALGAGPAGSAG
jgi:predicted glycoside hydrolase/deacetylase ChbG (UPF0249 family)